MMIKKTFILFMLILLCASSAFAADARSLINSASLTPTVTGFAPCDKIVNETLMNITNDNMTTYDRVKACYDYLINTCSYGRNAKTYKVFNNQLILDIGRVPVSNFSKLEGSLRAYDMLRSHVGVCDDYSCAFAALMRAIGLNCYTIEGLTAKAAGGMTGHAWCVINIDGAEYVFDPQIDDNIAKGGAIGYYRFCMTYHEVDGAYDPVGISNYFKPF